MYEEKSIEVGRNMFIMDVLWTSFVFIGAYFIQDHFMPGGEITFQSHVALLPLLLAFALGFLSYFGAYQNPCRITPLEYAWIISRAVALSVGAVLALLYLFDIQYVSRLAIITFAVIEVFTILALRIILRRYYAYCVRDGKSATRVLIIGTGERAKELSTNLRQQAEWGIDVIGHLDPDPTRIGQTIIDAPVIGTICDTQKVLKNNVVDEVIIAIPRSMLTDVEPIAQACEEEGIKLKFMADIYNVEVARTKLVKLGKTPLLSMEPVAQDEIQLLLKRTIDLVLVVLALPVLLPLLGIIAIAVKLDSPGPVLFIQQRVGLKKRLFPMLKFRSMYENAEAMLKEIEHLNEAEGPIFKMKNDPRVTRMGRFLRKTSLDELPQLLNVLAGQMSLVGPRPMSIRDVDLFDRGIQRKRFSVKPGITCLWQISGRSELPFSKWLELDLEYIENWSLWLDFKILFKTVPVVLLSKGAV